MYTSKRDNLETFQVVWFNSEMNSSANASSIVETKVRAIINCLIIFNDPSECRKYVENVTINDRIIVIIDSKSSQEIVPHIQELRQVSSIYIHKQEDTSTIFNFNQKVKESFSNIDELLTQLEFDYSHERRRFHNQIDEPLSMSICNGNRMLDHSSTSLNGDFIFSHMLIDVLLRMPSNDTDKNELLEVCRQEYQGNDARLVTLKEFERSYSSDKALFWYTKESFLYHLLNKALRIQNIDLLFLFRFFINDIYQQLKELQCMNKVRVYRGQLISTDELFVLNHSVGQLISMNSFLSTSFNRDYALFFLGSSSSFDELKRVLFEIDADPLLENIKPFADITTRSYFPNENEVLIMIGSIFRVESICEQNDQSCGTLHIIKLSLCSDNDDNTKLVSKTMKTQIGVDDIGGTSFLDFGKVLVDMGKFDDGEKYFRRLLCQLSTNKIEVADCYQGLGEVANGKGEYELSLEWLTKSLDIRLKSHPLDYDHVGDIYNLIGISFEGRGEYESALESYNKALGIWKQKQDDHPRIAACLNNIGIIYQKQDKYLESLTYHQWSLNITEKNLPDDHPHIAATVHNIGDVYYSLCQYQTALEYYERALEIFRKYRPNHHPDIAYTLGSIGLLYEQINELKKSVYYLQSSMEIYQKIMPINHRYRIKIDQSLLRVTEKLSSVHMNHR